VMVMTNAVSARHVVPVDEPAEPEVPERATRRVFSAQYKLRILAEYERRDRNGRLGQRRVLGRAHSCSDESVETHQTVSRRARSGHVHLAATIPRRAACTARGTDPVAKKR
jgi:hypothetical protein